MAECSSIRPSHPSLLDDEIAALALQLEELNTYSEKSKGKYAVDDPPNIDIAYASFQAELRNYQTFLSDMQLAQSIAAAVHTDGDIIAGITIEEFQALEDRNTAIEISTTDPRAENPPHSAHIATRSWVDDWMCSMSGYFDTEDETVAGPSMSYAERQANALVKLSETVECTACTEEFPLGRMITGKCHHRYCVDCIKNFFMRSTKDESLFPPKCCGQPIPIAVISCHLSPEESATFELKREEFSSSDRVYCSNIACDNFISPRMISTGTNRGVCTTCLSSTCTICRKPYHGTIDCPDDPEIRQTRDLARKKGWQTCPRCKRVVEIRTGCYHMVCRCRAEFCYLCAKKWKTCNCVRADIGRIEENAVDEEPEDRFLRPPAPTIRGNLVPGHIEDEIAMLRSERRINMF